MLNKQVTTINWDNKKHLVEVTCSDGTKYEAEHVIVTLSLGVLKRQYAEMFTPQLPQDKMLAIQGLAQSTRFSWSLISHFGGKIGQVTLDFFKHARVKKST